MRDPRWSEPKFYDFEGYLYTVNNSKMDVEGFIDSEYGKELADRLEIRHKIENDKEKAKEYYRNIGLKKEFHEDDNYFSRWSLLIPSAAEASGKKLPLVVYLHGMGNSIEAEENMTGFTNIAAKEGFYLCCPQNTNPDNVIRIINIIKSNHGIDENRVYLAGFSQGAEQLQAISIRNPELIAACVTSGNEIYRPWDNFDNDYSKEELSKFAGLRMPLMQISGQCEPFPYAPLNVFYPPMRFKPKWGGPDSFEGKDRNMQNDPTRVFIKTKDENGNDVTRPKMARHYLPGENEDGGRWNLERFNYRLSMSDCAPRDVNLCMSFKGLNDNNIRKITGVYGDYENVLFCYGYRHYVVGINDRENKEMYRFVVVENSPHWPQLAMGELGWDFMKKYHRDPESKKIVID